LPDFFVAAKPGATKRCIDGSTIDGYDAKDPKWQKRALGPQIQGGSVEESVAIRLSRICADPDKPVTSLVEDLKRISKDRASKYKEGDHTDVHADETKTGCGAIDGQLRKLDLYDDMDALVTIRSTVNSILGLVNVHVPISSFDKLIVAANRLAARPEYFSKPNDILQTLKDLNPDALEMMTRPHAEVSLTLNFVPDTTFDRDRYNSKSNSKIQNFNLDIWNILQEHGDDAFIVIADSVATAMDLTDGTLRLFARVNRGE
jgi:hypothetical protein